MIYTDIIKVSKYTEIRKCVYFCESLLYKGFIELKLSAIGNAIITMEEIVDELKDRNPDLDSFQNSYFDGKQKSIITLKVDKDIYKGNKDDKVLIIQYKIKPLKKVQIFGKQFVKLNKHHCKISYKGKQLNLNAFLDVNYDKLIEIKLIGVNNITNMDYMFSDCSSLVSINISSEWDTSKVTNMVGIFSNCKSLISLPDISKWDISKVTDLSGIFSDCISLQSLPDISKWDFSNVVNINKMFLNCTLLENLPDISCWKTSNIFNMSNAFKNCSSLKSLPDLSKWNISNVKFMNGLFSNCSSLVSLPDISKWDTSNIINISEIFQNCSSLISLPNISKWNTLNIRDISYIFSNCSSLISLPDISKWSFNVEPRINNLFDNCFSLVYLPDISTWNIDNKYDIYYQLLNSECINLSNNIFIQDNLKLKIIRELKINAPTFVPRNRIINNNFNNN